MPPRLDHTPISGEAICPYCGVGCRVWAEAGYGEIMRVKGVADAPANRGKLCAKGATLEQTVHVANRAREPLLRNAAGVQEPVSWDAAIDHVGARLAAIIAEHGPQAVAFYGSGQLDSQAVYCVSKLFKGGLRTNNTDSNSRLCMATAVAAYRTSLGSDGPPTCYDDIELADTIVIAGSNMAEAHPVTFDRIRAARRARPDLRIVVIDPRRTKTAEEADLHLPVRPGGDIPLFNALGRLLIESGDYDTPFVRQRCNGFDGYGQALLEAPFDELVAATGLAPVLLLEAASLLAPPRKVLSFFCMGLGQSTVGMWKINSLINLHLLTGNIGRPGCGPFSLTGQPNAMGGREIGLLAHQLPGYRFVENAAHREEVEDYWRLPRGSIAPTPGLTAVEMFRALERGKLKAIWIAATNPVVSLPDVHQVRRALARAELVIVQDAFHPTETTREAHVVLPVASWGEREWTSTNSERMVSHSEQIVDPPGEALPDWQIICRVAQRLGLSGFQFQTAGEVWNEWIGLSRGRPCDMSGMPHARLKQVRHLQWPCPSLEHPGTPRLYQDHTFAHPDGRAMFHYRPHREPSEGTDHEFPFVLTTGRIYAHWHTQTRTAHVRKLVLRDPAPYVELNADDAAQLQVAEGDLVQISSRRGTVRLPARIAPGLPRGLVFIPMHWGDKLAPENAVNYLTISAIGRVAKQPELKHCAVALEAVTPTRRNQSAKPTRTAAAKG